MSVYTFSIVFDILKLKINEIKKSAQAVSI